MDIKYYALVAVGVSYLWPWNCYLAASPYFMSRLAEYPVLRDNFASSMMTVSTVTSTVVSWVLARRQLGAKYEARVYVGEVAIATSFVLLALSCAITVDGALYFAFVMASVFTSTYGVALAQNGSFAVATALGPAYTQAVMVGQGVAGVLPPIIFISSSYFLKQPSTGATASPLGSALYFLAATVMAYMALVLFLWSMKSDYKIVSGSEENQPAEPISEEATTPLSELLKKLATHSFAVFYTFAITLTYPVVANNTRSFAGIADDIYMSFAFLVWNSGDLVGRLLCGSSSFMVKKLPTLRTYALGRTLLVVLLVTAPWTRSDLWYLFMQFAFGVTNGHLGTSAMVGAPAYVEEHQKKATGGFMTLVLSLGLAAGSLLSFLMVLVY